MSLKQEKHIIIEIEGDKHKLHIDEYSRWLSLLEAIHHVNVMAEQKNLDLDKYDWVKPLTFQKYIDQRCESLKEEVEKIESGHFIYSIPDPRINSGIAANFAKSVEIEAPCEMEKEVDINA